MTTVSSVRIWRSPGVAEFGVALPKLLPVPLEREHRTLLTARRAAARAAPSASAPQLPPRPHRQRLRSSANVSPDCLETSRSGKRRWGSSHFRWLRCKVVALEKATRTVTVRESASPYWVHPPTGHRALLNVYCTCVIERGAGDPTDWERSVVQRRVVHRLADGKMGEDDGRQPGAVRISPP
jgi:hypothetical protein